MKKLSDVFWEAANYYLSLDSHEYINEHGHFVCLHSCDAVSIACGDNHIYDTIYHAFMNHLGCDSESNYQFNSKYWKTYSEEEQGARYLWLMFCYQYAKELEDNVSDT